MLQYHSRHLENTQLSMSKRKTSRAEMLKNVPRIATKWRWQGYVRGPLLLLIFLLPAIFYLTLTLTAMFLLNTNV